MSDVRQEHSGGLTCEPLKPPERGFRLIGELDLGTTQVLEHACDGLAADGQVTLDLSALTFIDSSGLHAIIEYARGMNSNQPLIVANPSERVRRLFEIVKLDTHPAIDMRSDGDGE